MAEASVLLTLGTFLEDLSIGPADAIGPGYLLEQDLNSFWEPASLK